MNKSTDEINSGLLVMGLSNTVFFGEGVVHELVFLNISTGLDFSMQVSEEQAAYLVDVLNSQVNEEPQKTPNLGVVDAGEESAWDKSEETPQL